MYSFDEFIDKIMLFLKENVSEEDIVKRVEIPQNNNVVKQGISISIKLANNDRITSQFSYLDEAYEEYKQGEPFEDICEAIKTGYEEATSKIDDVSKNLVSNFTNSEYIKDNVQIKIVKLNDNSLLTKKKLVYTPIENMDFACIYYVSVKDDILHGSSNINQELFEKLDITSEELHKKALANSMERSQAVLYDMKDVVHEIILNNLGIDDYIPKNLLDDTKIDSNKEDDTKLQIIDLDEKDDTKSQMFVLTNPEKEFGAAVLVYPDVIKKVADKLEDDIYIIPSSVHESIIVPKHNKRKDSEELTSILNSVNEKDVDPAEVLSDKIYEYSRKEDKLTAVNV